MLKKGPLAYRFDLTWVHSRDKKWRNYSIRKFEIGKRNDTLNISELQRETKWELGIHFVKSKEVINDLYIWASQSPFMASLLLTKYIYLTF